MFTTLVFFAIGWVVCGRFQQVQAANAKRLKKLKEAEYS